MAQSELHTIHNSYGHNIDVHYMAPEGQPKGLVVYTHDLAGSIAGDRHIIETFLREGYAVVGVDARHSNNNHSYGDLKEYTMREHVDDVHEALEWIRKYHNKWTMGQPVMLSGHGMGGHAVLRIKGQGSCYKNLQTGKVFAFDPVVSGGSRIEAMNEKEKDDWQNNTHEEQQTENTGKSNKITDEYWSEWCENDLLDYAENIKNDIVIIQAEKNTITPVEYAEKLRDILNASYHVIKGVNHRFQYENGDTAIDKIQNIISFELEKDELDLDMVVSLYR